MTRPGMHELLIRAVLDETFRASLQTDFDTVVDGFDVSDEDREILRQPDERFLRLLGEAIRSTHPASNSPTGLDKTQMDNEAPLADDDAGANPPTPVAFSLPEIVLLLRVFPSVHVTPEGELNMAYAASVDPLPEGRAPDDIPRPDFDLPGQEVDSLANIVRIRPTAIYDESGRVTVRFSATMHPALPPEAMSSQGSTSRPPWHHHVDSESAREAAAEVRAAPPDKRYARLLDLVDALQRGDAHG